MTMRVTTGFLVSWFGLHRLVCFGRRVSGLGRRCVCLPPWILGEPHVGFYGGGNYVFGYGGWGSYGVRWEAGHFAYNTAVMNVNRTVIHNVYENGTVINHTA